MIRLFSFLIFLKVLWIPYSDHKITSIINQKFKFYLILSSFEIRGGEPGILLLEFLETFLTK